MSDIKYVENFSYREFACKCGKCGLGGVEISRELLTALQVVRTVYGKPMVIVSGLRCPTHNRNEGGKDDSAHLTGEAVDIEVGNSRDRYELLSLLMVNFQRIGIGDSFLHVDIKQDKTQQVVWTY